MAARDPLHCGLRAFSVALPGKGVEVLAENWLIALGEALHLRGLDGGVRQLACEVLPNGTCIVTDVAQGWRYVVAPLALPAAARREAA